MYESAKFDRSAKKEEVVNGINDARINEWKWRIKQRKKLERARETGTSISSLHHSKTSQKLDKVMIRKS